MLRTIEKCLAWHLSVRCCAISAHIPLFFPRSRFVQRTIKHCLFLLLRQPELASWAAQICEMTVLIPAPVILLCYPASAGRGKELRFARRLARNTAGEPARLHQHRADYIPSDKSVEGEESKEGKVKANEHKSGHSGTETIYRRCVQEKSQEGKDRLSKCSGGAPCFWFKRQEKSHSQPGPSIPICGNRNQSSPTSIVNLNDPPTHTHTHKHKYLFFLNWVINAAVVFANETRAEPPTNRSCRCQPAQWALWVGWLKQARLMNGTDQLPASGCDPHHPWSRMLR